MADVVKMQRVLTATVVAVTPGSRLRETTEALTALRARAAVRTILVTLGDRTQPEVLHDGDATVIEGIVPRYLNNAVASLRLSSLPSLAWWRGGNAEALHDLATLVDRLVLDSPKPEPDWASATELAELAALSDLRWTRLTRWRNLMAQFFDVPEVRAGMPTFGKLEIAAADPYAARLFAGWLTARLPRGRDLLTSIESDPRGEPLASVALSAADQRLLLQLVPTSNCIETTIVRDGASASRIVSLGDQSLAALLSEELRVRARDLAFEQALVAGAAA